MLSDVIEVVDFTVTQLHNHKSLKVGSYQLHGFWY